VWLVFAHTCLIWLVDRRSGGGGFFRRVGCPGITPFALFRAVVGFCGGSKAAA